MSYMLRAHLSHVDVRNITALPMDPSGNNLTLMETIAMGIVHGKI